MTANPIHRSQPDNNNKYINADLQSPKMTMKKKKKKEKNAQQRQQKWHVIIERIEEEEEIRATTTIQYRLSLFIVFARLHCVWMCWTCGVRSVGRPVNEWLTTFNMFVFSLLLLYCIHLFFLIWSMKLIYAFGLDQRWSNHYILRDKYI